MYIISYSTNGTYQWINQADSVTIDFLSTAISLSIDMGSLYALVLFDTGLNVYRNPYTGSYGSYTQITDATANANTVNMAILKYTINNTISNNGKIVWMNKVLHINNSINSAQLMNGFCIYSDGFSIYVTGGFANNPLILYNASVNMDPSITDMTLNPINTTQTSDPILDMFLLKYSADGVLNWATIGGAVGSFQASYSVSYDRGLITITGAAKGPISFYKGHRSVQPSIIGGSITPATNSNYYSYVAKYGAEGSYVT
jgi:hypothetical protein